MIPKLYLTNLYTKQENEYELVMSASMPLDTIRTKLNDVTANQLRLQTNTLVINIEKVTDKIQNLLLKFIEEYPYNLKIVFPYNTKIIPTIQSRVDLIKNFQEDAADNVEDILIPQLELQLRQHVGNRKTFINYLTVIPGQKLLSKKAIDNILAVLK